MRRAYILDSQNVYYELGELVRPACNRLGAIPQVRVILEQLRVKYSHHTRAGARRRNDVFATFKNRYEAPSQIARFTREAAIERRLSATGLRGRKVDFCTELAKHSYHAHPYIRKELIDEAGYEQRDSHFALILPAQLRIKTPLELQIDTRARFESSDFVRGSILAACASFLPPLPVVSQVFAGQAHGLR
jgi:hypothetical protein